jgi:hypothetical protein
MSGSPDEEFGKIFELLNAFEQLDEEEQRAFLDPTEPPAQPPPKPVSFVPDAARAAEPEAENTFAANIAAAMVKRTK